MGLVTRKGAEAALADHIGQQASGEPTSVRIRHPPYQTGVYEALVEHGIAPTWIAGISIGAINSAIIAGNALKDRVSQTRAFWEKVSSRGPPFAELWPGLRAGLQGRHFADQMSACEALVSGLPGFFSPRFPPPPLQPKGSLGAESWYETKDLRSILERLVDFDRNNAKRTRLSVGAVNVCTGNFACFDNTQRKIQVEHVMASGASPPGFPEIDFKGEFYWDGGLVTNNPLNWVLSDDLAQVAVRMKEIQFSSRTRAITDTFRHDQELRTAFDELLAQLPPELAALPQARRLAAASDPAVYNNVELICHSATYKGQSKDYEFSQLTMDDHWRAGHRDAVKTLAHPEVLKRPAKAAPVNVFDFLQLLRSWVKEVGSRPNKETLRALPDVWPERPSARAASRLRLQIRE